MDESGRSQPGRAGVAVMAHSAAAALGGVGPASPCTTTLVGRGAHAAYLFGEAGSPRRLEGALVVPAAPRGALDAEMAVPGPPQGRRQPSLGSLR